MPRFILTGTPGAGKTALLRRLEVQGYPVVEEAATDVIALQQALGHDKPPDMAAFIDTIVTLQRRRQINTSPADDLTVFFDRSPLCTLALSRYSAIAPSSLLVEEIDRILAQRVYEPCVFFVRHQGFVQPTPARRISFDNALVFERIHEQVYVDFGFHLIDIPAGPLTDRLALVTHTISRWQATDRRHISGASGR